MAATSDHNVTETAFDAAKCKLSAVTLGYFRDDFLRLVVDKPSRRIPLIHRGYYLRHVAITHHVDAFLAQHDAHTPVNILSLGAGFDTLFFRLVQRQEEQRATRRVRFVEVDCAPVVEAKAALLRARSDAFLPPGARPAAPTDAQEVAAFRCALGEDAEATYALLACDLGDTSALARRLDVLQVDTSRPTLVLAECVVAYLEPERGSELLAWLARSFQDATAVLYDPVALDDAFGAQLQRYFAAKGCELRALRTFRSANDHLRRFLARAGWRTCALMDMNEVYARLTTREAKARLATLEPFDEHADWWLCNAHYGIFVASNASDLSAAGLHAYHGAGNTLVATGFPSRSDVATAATTIVVRTFQTEDLARVQELFRATHLSFAATSKAVRKFVDKRLQPPDGDLVDVSRSFRRAGRAFWVAEMDGQVVGCVGVKPAESEKQDGGESAPAAELCRLSVDAASRRCGVASALVATLEAFARGHGYKRVCLETIGAMDAAQRLYRARGYTETSTATFSSFSLVRFQKSLAA